MACKVRPYFYTMDVYILLSVGCGTTHVKMKWVAIKHHRVVMSISATKKLDRESIIRYNRTVWVLEHEDHFCNQHSTKTYG